MHTFDFNKGVPSQREAMSPLSLNIGGRILTVVGVCIVGLTVATFMFLYSITEAQGADNINNMNDIEFPWKVGETWSYSGGPHRHDDMGKDDRKPPFHSLDFAPRGTSVAVTCPGGAKGLRGNSYVLNPRHREGWVESINGLTTTIRYSDGYGVMLVHLLPKADLTKGAKVGIDQVLGYPSSCGHSDGGVHIHLTFLKGSTMLLIVGAKISGWTVGPTVKAYGPSKGDANQKQGCLSKEGEAQICPSYYGAPTNPPVTKKPGRLTIVKKIQATPSLVYGNSKVSATFTYRNTGDSALWLDQIQAGSRLVTTSDWKTAPWTGKVYDLSPAFPKTILAGEERGYKGEGGFDRNGLFFLEAVAKFNGEWHGIQAFDGSWPRTVITAIRFF